MRVVRRQIPVDRRGSTHGNEVALCEAHLERANRCAASATETSVEKTAGELRPVWLRPQAVTNSESVQDQLSIQEGYLPRTRVPRRIE